MHLTYLRLYLKVVSDISIPFICGILILICRSEPSVPCCDICEPSLFNHVRPGIRRKKSKADMPKKGEPAPEIQAQLRQWRKDIFKRDHELAQYEAQSLLSNELLVGLSSHGPLSRSNIASMLSETWIWWQRYGDELTAFLETLEIPFTPIVKLSKQSSTQQAPKEKKILICPETRKRTTGPSEDNVLSPKRTRVNADIIQDHLLNQSRTPSSSDSHTLSTSSSIVSHQRSSATDVPLVLRSHTHSQISPYPSALHATYPNPYPGYRTLPVLTSSQHRGCFSYPQPLLFQEFDLPAPQIIVPSQASQSPPAMSPDSGSNLVSLSTGSDILRNWDDSDTLFCSKTKNISYSSSGILI